MIRKARMHFICITMCILTGVLLLPMVALNVIPRVLTYNQSKTMLQKAVENEICMRTNSKKPDEPPLERYTVVESTTGTTVTEMVSLTVSTDNTAIVTMSSLETNVEAMNTTVPVAKKESSTTTMLQTEAISSTIQQPILTKPVETKSPVLSTEKDNNQYPDRPFPDEEMPWKPEEPWHPQMERMVYQEEAQTFLLSANNIIPDKKKEWKPFQKENDMDYFLLVLKQDGTIQEALHAEEYTENDLMALVSYVEGSQKQDGYCDTIQYYAQKYEKGKIIAFTDCSKDRLFLQKLLFVSAIVFILMEILVLLLTMLLTKRAMRPMQISFEKQKQFISDAGHELKTPLTIISANADILQDEIGESKWLDYIRMQTERMRILVDEMMALTKLEHTDVIGIQERFHLSSLVETTVLPFESQAFEQQKKLNIFIQPDLYFVGEPEQIRRMIGIFIDNAFKYGEERGEIRVSLQESGGRVMLEVYNTGKGIRMDEKEKIFERFYRSDSSRARSTGGYGLGLSIAKKVAETHKIKLDVTCEEGKWIMFTLLFPPASKKK